MDDMPQDAQVQAVAIFTDAGELLMVVETGTLTLGEVFSKLQEVKGGSGEELPQLPLVLLCYRTETLHKYALHL